MATELNTEYYNRAGAEDFLERLRSYVLLAQGPMGSVLQSELFAADIPPAYWNLAEPQTVQRIHTLYSASGAEVGITNSFQASAPCLERDTVFRTVGEVNRAAVDNARLAQFAYVLGSVGPAGVEWFKEDSPEYRYAREVYRDQAAALLQAGVDALLLETFTSIRDLQPALAGALDAADGMPILVSFAVNDEGDLYGDGLNIEAAVVWAEKHGAQAVGVNCCSISAATAAVPRMKRAARTPVMVRPNAGNPVQTADGPVWHENPDAFAAACEQWVKDGAALVGGCCGSTAKTTAAMADVLQNAL